MKNARSILSGLLCASLLGATTFAATSTPVPSAPAARSQPPHPAKVVPPTDLPWEYENATVELKITIDENGVPHDIAPVARIPDQLAHPLVSAVSQWRFTPMTRNGKPTRAKVIIPLKLVRGA